MPNSKIGSELLSLFPPIEAFIGVIKRIINFNKSNEYEAFNAVSSKNDECWYDDRKAKNLPYTSSLSRAAVLLLTLFLVLGFIGTLVIPLPGIAPLFGFGAIGIAKACGISIGYTTAARIVGVFFGAIFDTHPIRESLVKRKISRPSIVIRTTINYGISRIIMRLFPSLTSKSKKPKNFNDQSSSNLTSENQESESTSCLSSSNLTSENQKSESTSSLPASNDSRLKNQKYMPIKSTTGKVLSSHMTIKNPNQKQKKECRSSQSATNNNAYHPIFLRTTPVRKSILKPYIMYRVR